MRTLDYTGQFKRDYKREAKGRHRSTLEADLHAVLSALLNDQPLETRHRDHALTGDWVDHRDCHINATKSAWDELTRLKAQMAA